MKGVRVAFPAPRRVELEEYEAGEPGPGQVLLKTETTGMLLEDRTRAVGVILGWSGLPS